MKKIIKVCAGFILKNGKFLVIKQDKGAYKNLLWLPAGRKNRNETLKQCVIREVKEETGYDVKLKKLILKNIIHFKKSIYEIYIFRCDLIGGKKQTNFEIKKVYWKSTRELLQKPKKVVPLVLDVIIRLKHFNELVE